MWPLKTEEVEGLFVFVSSGQNSTTANPDQRAEPLAHRANFALLIRPDRHTGLLSCSSFSQTGTSRCDGWSALAAQPEAAMQQIREFVHQPGRVTLIQSSALSVCN